MLSLVTNIVIVYTKSLALRETRVHLQIFIVLHTVSKTVNKLYSDFMYTFFSVLESSSAFNINLQITMCWQGIYSPCLSTGITNMWTFSSAYEGAILLFLLITSWPLTNLHFNFPWSITYRILCLEYSDNVRYLKCILLSFVWGLPVGLSLA